MRLLTIVLSVLICSCAHEQGQVQDSEYTELDSVKDALTKEVDLLELRKDSLEKVVIGLDSLVYDNEDFHEFFMSFVHDSAFSETRIIRPILYESGLYADSLTIDTVSDWLWTDCYRLLKGQDATNTDVYDNFQLKGNKTNERVLHKHALEQCGDIRYFFQGFDGKWKLIKIQQIGA